MSVIYKTGEDIRLFATRLKNGVLQSGDTITYEVYNRVGVLEKSGTLTEVGTSGIYQDLWASPGYTLTTNLTVLYSRAGKIIGSEEIVVIDIGGSSIDFSSVLTAIEEADKYSDGRSY